VLFVVEEPTLTKRNNGYQAFRGSSFLFVYIMMPSQNPIKMTIGQLSLAYNQAVIPLNVAEGRFFRLRHIKARHFLQ
jgi:hypothetical protein